MAIESLPREIVDYVVANLSQKRDLSSVSLVSSYLSTSARPLLFADLCLSCDPSDPNNTLQSFITFLSSSHDICDFVHSLTLQTKQSGSGSSLPLVSFKLTSELLSKLPNLKGLHLKNIGLCWHDGVPTDAYQARYSLNRLSLTNATGEDDIAPLLEMFKTIGELTIINESFFFTARVSAWREGHERNRTAESFLEIFQRSISPHLEVSKLRMDTNPLNAAFYSELLRRTRTAQTITSFDLAYDILAPQLHSSSPMFKFLHETGANLQHITLSSGDRERMWYPDASRRLQNVKADYASDEMRARLSTLTGLQSVTFRLLHRKRSDPLLAEGALWFSALWTLLAAFPPTVRRIELSFCDLLPEETGIFRQIVDLPPLWNTSTLDLDALEPMLLRYTQLEAVVFHDTCGIAPDERVRITRALPELTARGLVQFADYQVEAGLANSGVSPFVGGVPSTDYTLPMSIPMAPTSDDLSRNLSNFINGMMRM